MRLFQESSPSELYTIITSVGMEFDTIPIVKTLLIIDVYEYDPDI